jgi:CheY-like chemotaxis protein
LAKGRGTTITIYLPQYAGPLQEERASASHRQVPVAGAGETVLVLDDEPVIRSLIAEVLRDFGYHILEAADGTAGLKILNSNQRVDLLITDVGLPGINGRQVAEQARVSRPQLKVLFVTGYAESAAQAADFLNPGMEMITKPFAIEAFTQRVRHMIGDGEDVVAASLHRHQPTSKPLKLLVSMQGFEPCTR